MPTQQNLSYFITVLKILNHEKIKTFIVGDVIIFISHFFTK